MALSPGTRVGSYEVIALAGTGGMGEVYRARDTRLKREVALKVLPPVLTQDRERLARFQREAELLASLNHPHIAAIYGLEEADGVHAIVMEFVDGGTIADRLKASGPLPTSEALAIARQVVEALEAAHDKGIIHRDLKPGNIALTGEGQVKVLDFGLAKALAPELHPHQDITNSPTLTSPAMTQMGLILGTAAYMSPEQAKGRPADKRSDVWAFGCVLYEMLTGRRPFDGEDVSDTLAAVLRGDPDWAALPNDLPVPVRTLIQRCLEKDRRGRVGDIAAALFVLNESSLAAPSRAETVVAPPAGRMGERVVWLGVAALTGALAFWLARPGVTPAVPIRFQISAPVGSTVGAVGIPAVSPDGRRAVFSVARAAGQGTVLALRSFDTLESRVLDGTEGALAPFWSPESRFVAFQSDGKLKKIDINGGPPQILCDARALNGGAWSPDGTIIFSPSGASGLMRVSQAGGAASPATTLDATRQERSHRWPWFLPDGRHFLFVSQAPTKIYVGSTDSPDRTEVLESSTFALYSDGHVLFVRDGTLLAQPFDTRTLKVHGEAVPVAEEVWYNAATAGMAASASSSGVLAYRTGSTREPSQLVWFDRTGKRLGVVGEVADQMNGTFSNDGRKVAVSLLDPVRNSRDIALYDLAHNSLRTRFTFDPADEWGVVWSPDGSRLAFNGTRKNGQLDIYVKATTGMGNEELILDDPANNLYPSSWSPDGRFLLFNIGNANSPTGNDIFALPITGEPRTAVPVVQSPFNETAGQFSPDGRWVAFQTNESGGRTDIFVVPFTTSGGSAGSGAAPPALAGKWQVSTAGGTNPRWRKDGKELFYLSADDKLMAAAVRTDGAAFEVGAVQELFPIRTRRANWLGFGTGWNFDVSADGQRFLVNTVSGDAMPLPITVVMNWTTGLAK